MSRRPLTFQRSPNRVISRVVPQPTKQKTEAGYQRIEDDPLRDMCEHVVSDLVRHDQSHFGVGRFCDGVVIEHDLRSSTEAGYDEHGRE